MRELEFVEAAAINAVQMEGVLLQSPACQKCLKTFQENMRLALGIAAAPGWTAMITMQWNMAVNNAAVAIWGPDWINMLSNAPPEELKKWEKGKHETMGEIIKENDPLLRHNLEVMTRQTDDLAWRCGSFVRSMMEGLLKTICIQAWTAIEVLLEDLHGEAVDTHTASFSKETLERRARQVANTKGQKFYFRRRDAFREAYDFAFSLDPAIHAAVWHPAVDALAAVRHLLVHRGGITDQEFEDDVGKAPSSALSKFSDVSKGMPLRFDGKIVRQLVDDAASEAYNLIRAVDAWLISKHLAGLPK